VKRTDFLLAALGVVIIFLLAFPPTQRAFFGFTDRYYLLGGFIKFFLFATFGDLISRRIRDGDWRVPGLFFKALVWGILGIFIVIAFRIFTTGVDGLQETGVLPGAGVTFLFAFFTSFFMNLFFAPAMMLVHRVSDQFIDMRVKKTGKSLKEAVISIDYPAFVGMLAKTIPLFWIPAHTITFLLEERYRAFFASLLGVMLGLLLNLFKKNA